MHDQLGSQGPGLSRSKPLKCRSTGRLAPLVHIRPTHLRQSCQGPLSATDPCTLVGNPIIDWSPDRKRPERNTALDAFWNLLTCQGASPQWISSELRAMRARPRKNSTSPNSSYAARKGKKVTEALHFPDQVWENDQGQQPCPHRQCDTYPGLKGQVCAGGKML